MEIKVRNVVEALHRGAAKIQLDGVGVESRNGPTLEIPEPVYTFYERPTERVLFSADRDANPFLHFFEALWMLAGREDLKFMTSLTKNFVRYSDDGETMQGSYGYRWRSKFDFDQLEEILGLLSKDPESRRAVLTMWDPRYDLRDNVDSSDIPCNTTIYFKVRDGKLHMTVNNRSNDMLFGAYGANVVHMSMLQEYMAAHLNLRVGRMIQQSDSFHVYTEGEGGKVWNRVKDGYLSLRLWDDPYTTGEVAPYPMFDGMRASLWDADLYKFFLLYDRQAMPAHLNFNTAFFQEVVTPMWLTYVSRDIEIAETIGASDWRKACTEWLERRQK